MTRVLLFVQTGDGRPKQVGHGRRGLFDSRGVTMSLLAIDGADGSGPWYGTDWMRRAQRNADRWWLVECENAEAGRVLILRSQRIGGPDDWTRAMDKHEPVTGRILASGGRAK